MSGRARGLPLAYVFGYASLVADARPLIVDGRTLDPVPGRLQGFRRLWGAAMNNWETVAGEKHFVDPGGGGKPRIKVAYLDLEPAPGASVNGLAIPVDGERLAELDRREVNYERVDVSSSFQPPLPVPVLTYMGTAAARARCRPEPGAEVCVSRDYARRVRGGFTALGPEQLAEYERTTVPLPFPERDLELRPPAR